MCFSKIKEDIIQGRTIVGIELGSTRIKTVLIGPDNNPVASGGFDWQNQLDKGCHKWVSIIFYSQFAPTGCTKIWEATVATAIFNWLFDLKRCSIVTGRVVHCSPTKRNVQG